MVTMWWLFVAPLSVSGSLTVDMLPPRVTDVEYAVRGEIVIRAGEIEKELENPNHGYPFDEIIRCNIGNPQAVGQSPVTFHRQVLSLVTLPEMIKGSSFEKDVVERATKFSNATKFGAYAHSKGVELFRHMVCDFIERRDGPNLGKVDAESIFLTDGASAGVKMSLGMLIKDMDDGVLIPIPQYPLYSAAITSLSGTAAGYYLDEAGGWSVPMPAIEAAIRKFRKDRPNGRLKALVMINPGNPTGNLLSRAQMQEMVKLCERESLVLLADEVYQENVWSATKKWESFRKVALEMKSPVEVVSFHSISKGYSGECGLRGGYMQFHNSDSKVIDQVYKMASITLCSNTLGQAMIASIVNPPRAGEPSFPTFEIEKTKVLASLGRKAKFLVDRLNQIEGVSCQPIEGAMYAFPSVILPPGAIKAAEAAGKVPDTFYCLAMLEATGIVVVPGSGFFQKEGTWHYRITILPAEEKLPKVLDRYEAFHKAFIAKYSKTEL